MVPDVVVALLFSSQRCLESRCSDPLVRVRAVFRQQNSLRELVCLQAIWFYPSEATTSGETTKKLKSGRRGRIAAWPLETHASRFLVFGLFCFFAEWLDVGSAEARCCFLDPSGV